MAADIPGMTSPRPRADKEIYKMDATSGHYYRDCAGLICLCIVDD